MRQDNGPAAATGNLWPGQEIPGAICPNEPDRSTWPAWTRFVKVEQFDGAECRYENSRYSVTVRVRRMTVAGRTLSCFCLGVANRDQSARHDWRDFQRIKNELLGTEVWAYEVYPAEDHKCDPSNYFLLWCFPADAIAPQRVFEEGELR
jgi:hypothetical protein